MAEIKKINTELQLESALRDGNGSPGTNGQVLSSTGTATDWISLSEIQGVDGTGTANYISKWSDTDTITNSIIFDNGTNVGIGTASPSQKLDVAGSINLTGNVFSDQGFYGNRLWNSDNTALRFATNNAERMRISSSGNVGVGTTTPTEKLEVAGNVKLDGDNRHIYFGGNNTFIGERSNSTELELRGGGNITAHTVYIDNTGQIGVGTTSPSEKLEVAGNIVVNGSNDSADGLHLKDRTFVVFSDAGSVVSRFRSSASGIFQFQDGNYNTNVVLNNNGNSYLNGGNVGIGTTSPEAKLTIKGDALNTNQPVRITNSVTDTHTGLFLNNTGATVGEKYGMQFGGYNQYSIGGIFGVLDSVSGSTSGDITFDMCNGTSAGSLIERMRITHEGNVGIGTNSPFGTAANRTCLSVNGSTDVSLNIGTGGVQKAYLYSEGSYARLATIGSIPLTLGVNDTERMRIDSSGNVGIGTTSPGAKLEVAGHIKLGDGNKLILGAGSDLNIFHDGANSYFENKVGDLIFRQEADDKDIIFKSDNGSGGDTEYFRLDGGLGYSVAEKSIRMADGQSFFVGTGLDGLVSHSGTNMLIANEVGDFVIKNNANDKDIILQSDNGSGGVTAYLTLDGSTTHAYFSNPGNVGIGTTSPNAKLQVSGNSFFESDIFTLQNKGIFFNGIADFSSGIAGIDSGTSVRIFAGGSEKVRVKSTGNVGIGTASPSYKLEVHDNTTDTHRIRVINGNTGQSGLDLINSQQYTRLIAVNNKPFYVYDQTANSELFTIKSGGNVGIGATSPSTKLHLADSSDVYLTLESTSATTPEEVAVKYSNQPTGSNYWWQGLNQSADWSLGYGTSFSGSSTKLLVDTSGNVGIGTTSPQNLLHLGDNTNSKAGTIRIDSFVANQFWKIEPGTNTLNIKDYDGTSLVSFDGANNYALFNGGNVGIGTTSPTSPLTIKSNSVSSSSSGLTIQSNSNTNNIFELAEKSTDGARLQMYDAGVAKIALYTDGTDNYINAGNVGIGTTSPSARLEVLTTTANKFVRFRADNNEQRFEFYVGASGNASRMSMHNDAATETIRFASAGNSYFNSGNVGIGTNNPTRPLYVKNASAQTVAVFDGGNNSAGEIGFKGSGTTGETYVTIGAVGNDMSLSAGAAEKVRITSSGNVGIGTPSPTEKLDVVGNVKLRGTNNLTIGSTSNGGNFSLSSGIRGFNFANNNGDLVRIDANGNVGIGITSPDKKLEVFGDIKISGGDYNGLFFENASGTTKTLLYQHAGYDALVIKDIVNNADRVTFKNNGNVGIGTSSPSQKLHVEGTTYSTSGYKLNNGFSIGALGYNSAIRFNNGNILVNNSSSAEFVRFDATNSRVGIGTTSPNAKLNVNGNVKIEGTNPLYFGGSGSVPNWEIKAYGSGGNDLLINDTGTNSGDLIFTGQDFGVGTTNPSEKLHVSGEPHPSIRLSSSSDSNYNVVINCGYRNEALNLSVGGYKVFTTEGYNTPETTHLYSNNSKALSLASNQAATFTSTVTATNFINSSDERLKENIEKVRDNSLDVKWKTFEFKSDRGQKRYGVIAQELEKTNPEFVREDDQGFKSVAYIDLLIAKIAELEERIQTLENK